MATNLENALRRAKDRLSALKSELSKCKDAVSMLADGKPLGEVACKYFVQNTGREINSLREVFNAASAFVNELDEDETIVLTGASFSAMVEAINKASQGRYWRAR